MLCTGYLNRADLGPAPVVFVWSGKTDNQHNRQVNKIILDGENFFDRMTQLMRWE